MSVRARPLLGVLVLCGLLACARVGDDRGGARVPIDHIVVLFLENRSFDHLFGTYPGAEGLAAYRGKQAGENGVTYATLPRPLGPDGKPDPRFPSDLPNAPFPMLKFVGPLDQTNNPVHRFYHMQRQYGPGADGVPMGKWVAEGTSGGTTMGYYEQAAIPVQWRLAQEFVLLDHYFQGIHGGSFANHFYLIAATLATYPDAPAVVRAELAPDGGVVKDGDVDREGRVVNNLDPPYPPQRVPNILQTPQTAPTIADRLAAAGGRRLLVARRGRDHVRRGRRLVRPRPAAGGRPLRARHARPGAHRLAVREARRGRARPVRPRVDPETHRVALRARAPDRARSPGGGVSRSVRLRATRAPADRTPLGRTALSHGRGFD